MLFKILGVFFVSEKHTFVKLNDTGVYCDLGVAQDNYVCIKQEDLLDLFPYCSPPFFSRGSMSREESEDTGYVRRDVSSRAGYVVIAN